MCLEFTPLGVGDAFSARWYSSCLLVEHGESRLLIDCPHPIRKMVHEAESLRERRIDLDRIDAVVLTHIHADHCSGLESFAFYFRFALGRRVRLLAHATVLERLWDDCLRAGMDALLGPSGQLSVMRFEDYFEPLELDFSRPITEGPFDVECRPTRHHIPTTALRISAGGCSLGYSADTAFDPGLIDWLADCDRIVHETNLGTHTPYERLAALPAEIRDKMYLIHFDDRFDASNSMIEPLRQGRRYRVEAA